MLRSFPDPVIQERLEDMGFFRDPDRRDWSRFCSQSEVESIAIWLKNHRLDHRVGKAQGRGMLKKYPRLSDLLLHKDGGNPTTCALCGARGVFCRKWIEGDDTDSIDSGAAWFLYVRPLRAGPHGPASAAVCAGGRHAVSPAWLCCNSAAP